MGALAKVLPPDVAVIEEAVTTTNTTFERLGVLKNTTGYFGHRGWALGWGLGVAIGAKLAWPERPVLALLGEGAAAYGIQGLWSAARYKIPVVFVICNNAQYQILKLCGRSLSLPEAGASNSKASISLARSWTTCLSPAASASRPIASPSRMSWPTASAPRSKATSRSCSTCRFPAAAAAVALWLD